MAIMDILLGRHTLRFTFLLKTIPNPLSKIYLSTMLSTTFLFVRLTIRTVAAVLAILAVASYYWKG
jgi:hypothetical protein